MKKILTLSLFAAFLSANAFAAAIETGTYTEKHRILLRWVNDKQTCKQEGGKWDAKDEMCTGSAENEVIVSKTAKDYNISIATIGGNVHTCDFEAAATLQADGSLISKLSDHDGLCVVTVKPANTFFSKGLSVTTNENCSSFCGSAVSLDITRAKKVK